MYHFRQYAEYVSTQMMESEGSIAGKEVRGLPDSVGECNMNVIVIFFLKSGLWKYHARLVQPGSILFKTS